MTDIGSNNDDDEEQWLQMTTKRVFKTLFYQTGLRGFPKHGENDPHS